MQNGDLHDHVLMALRRIIRATDLHSRKLGKKTGLTTPQLEIGNYYKQYVDLMNHWDEVLPGFVLRVQHEDVIDDLETQVRRILDFCGLEFEESCVEFHKTKRTVRTPSAEQVRQPINTSGIDQWRNFEEYLDPLKRALGPELLKTYGIDPPR